MAVRLDKEQKKAVNHIDGPFLCIAGSGSGKTTVIIHRVLSLVKAGIDPNSILVMTFSRKAAEELNKRYLGLSGAVPGPLFSTIHAFANQVRKDLPGYGQFKVLGDAERSRLIKQIITDMGTDILPSTYDMEATMKLITTEISKFRLSSNKARENFLTIVFRDNDAFFKFYKEYEKMKWEIQSIDYDDMLIFCNNGFKNNPALLARYRAMYSYIMVDEFQDTSDIQYNIIKNLAAPQNNLFICGDDDQSIYGFNNAKPEIMLGFPDAYPGCGVARLSTNYRSDTDIVKAAGNLIHNNTARFEKDIVGKSKEEGHVELIYSKMDELIYQPIIRKVISENEEGVPFYDMAILTRTNKEGKFFALMCQKKIIPYYCAYSEVNLYKGALWNLLAPLCQKIRHQHKQNQTESSCCQPLLNSVSLHIFLSGLQHIHYHLNHLFISLFLHRSNSILQFPGSEKHLFCLFYGSIFLDEVQIGLHLSLNHDSGFFRFSHGFFYYGSFQIICDRFLEERFNSFSIFFPCL